MRDDSKVGGTPGVVVTQCALSQAVELPVLCIGLELPVRAFGVKLRKPLPECRQFFGRKFFNLALDARDSTRRVAAFKYIGASSAIGARSLSANAWPLPK